MPATVDEVAREALALLPDQRLDLARRLLESVDPEPQPGAAAAWDQEITERMRQLDAGEVKGIPASEVFTRLRTVAPGR